MMMQGAEARRVCRAARTASSLSVTIICSASSAESSPPSSLTLPALLARLSLMLTRSAQPSSSRYDCGRRILPTW